MKWRIAEVEPFSKVPVPPTTVVLIDSEQDWKYFEGTEEPSNPTNKWRQLSFNENSWPQPPDQAPIGYGEPDINTTVDMRYNYTTIYLRKTFEISNPADYATLTVKVRYDDGYNLWINGIHAASANVSGQNLAYNATANSAGEPGSYVPTVLDPVTYLVAGTNIIAVQVLNASLDGSSDCLIDAMLEVDTTGAPESSGYSMGAGKYDLGHQRYNNFFRYNHYPCKRRQARQDLSRPLQDERQYRKMVPLVRSEPVRNFRSFKCGYY
jgi:hypothetical protein